CLVFSQGVPEVRKELGSFVNRELAKRLKALVGSRDDFLCLRRCEVRECFDLLTSRRVYSCKSCLIHICFCSLSLLVINDRVRSEALRTVHDRSRVIAALGHGPAALLVRQHAEIFIPICLSTRREAFGPIIGDK